MSSPDRDPDGQRGDIGNAGNAPSKMRASQLLRVRAIWITPLAVASVLVFLMTLFYIGSVVNPLGHLSGLPVAIADEDQGATVLGRHVDIGAQVASGLRSSNAVSSRLSLHAVTLAQAEDQMKSNDAYATIVIPPHFTASLLSAYALDLSSLSPAGKPTVRLLTNPRSGSIGVELASGVAEPGLHAASLEVGRQLSMEASRLGRSPGAGVSAANPITVATSAFNPVPPNSALGLSAFYIALLAIMCGFLGGILVNTTVDAALGYGTTEIGPKWSQRLPVAISRWHTLMSKWVVAVVTVPVLVGVLLLVAVAILGMNAPYVGEL